MAKVLVLGATGNLGKKIAREVIEQGYLLAELPGIVKRQRSFPA